MVDCMTAFHSLWLSNSTFTVVYQQRAVTLNIRVMVCVAGCAVYSIVTTRPHNELWTTAMSMMCLLHHFCYEEQFFCLHIL